MFLLPTILILIAFLQLIFSMYYRFIKKKPLRFEHSLIKVFTITREVGIKRVFKIKDTIVLALALIPFLIWYPNIQLNLIMVYITLNVMLMTQSLLGIMVKQKHEKTSTVARINLTLVLFLTVMVFIV